MVRKMRFDETKSCRNSGAFLHKFLADFFEVRKFLIQALLRRDWFPVVENKVDDMLRPNVM